ncbi:uncharacterized protein A4U43_C02F11440 [Asparagus officinalis]|uniref:Uncharacterized protein n=1 Tax=Asparagus officinalis TaxID=4686 RepID=A0A5P1FHJ0_ASPOF|nr:uncharacterized protein A4U43_C02F11440 [Asparagus officinalis]
MRYTLTRKEDRVKVVSLKHDDGFHQEGLYRVNVINLHLAFIHEDAPVNKVVIVLNIFGNELAKNDAQYPDRDTRFPGKELILLDQVNPNKEEKVDYDSTYFTELDNAANDELGLETMDGVTPTHIPTSGKFEPIVDFNCASRVLESNLATDMTISPAPALVSVAWCILVVTESEDDVLVSLILVGVRRPTELTKEWDPRVTELEVEMMRLPVVRAQAAPIDPKTLRERAQKNAHELGILG